MNALKIRRVILLALMLCLLLINNNAGYECSAQEDNPEESEPRLYVPFKYSMSMGSDPNDGCDTFFFDATDCESIQPGQHYGVFLLTIEYIQSGKTIGYHRRFEECSLGLAIQTNLRILADNIPDHDEVNICYEYYTMHMHGQDYQWSDGQYRDTYMFWTTAIENDAGNLEYIVFEGAAKKLDFAKWFKDQYEFTPEMVFKSSMQVRATPASVSGTPALQ